MKVCQSFCGSNVKHHVQTAEVTECSLFSLIDRDHILQLNHDDHIKTLTHSLQKYNISITSNDIVLLVFALISVVCDCVVEQLQYRSAVSVHIIFHAWSCSNTSNTKKVLILYDEY